MLLQPVMVRLFVVTHHIGSAVVPRLQRWIFDVRRRLVERGLHPNPTFTRTVPRAHRNSWRKWLVFQALVKRVFSRPRQGCSGLLQKGLIAVANAVRRAGRVVEREEIGQRSARVVFGT